MRIFKQILIWCRNLFLLLFALSILIVLATKFIPVYYTPLIFIRLYEQQKEGKEKKLEHKWVPLSQIAQPLIQAVVASEDNLFMEHNGFDFEQIEKAMDEAEKGRRVRGASTISQQTAKNVFLWPGKSFFRKGLEAYFTVLIEFIWGKKRIMEVYLNSIEMGDGIYGAESVALAHFNKHAYQLTRQEAALIAVTLPNPRQFNSAKPSAYIQKRQSQILSLMSKLLPIEMGYGTKKMISKIRNSPMTPFQFHDLGLIDYSDSLNIQTSVFETLVTAKKEGQQKDNQLFFCEHHSVITIGKSGKDNNLLIPENLLPEKGISLYHTNRGGDITYHGPGQITGYPVFDLEYWQLGLKQYIHLLEEVIIHFLALYNIHGERLGGATGVWIDPTVNGRTRKICAIGVKSSRHVTMHGFALNINTDLSYFSLMNPCGFVDKGVTSLAQELGEKQDFAQAKRQLLMIFRDTFR